MSSSPLYSAPILGRTIRLLHIEPGETDSAIQCRLTTLSLDDEAVTYLAVSYVWGSGNNCKLITCNGHSIEVTTNLHTFLVEYRRRGTNGNDLWPLWVDALCIDQSNDEERTRQVRMMQHIYSQAGAVVIWLGSTHPTDDNIDLKMLETIHAPWKTHRGLPLYTGQDALGYDAWLAENLPDRAFVALAEFLQTPWFHRIWVVQELLSAKQAVMWRGELYLDVETMLSGAGRIASLHNVNIRLQVGTAKDTTRMHIACAGRLALLREALRHNVPLTMFYLLNATRNFASTDPRDKLFALVGLASDLGEDFVDYSKDLRELSVDLSRRFLNGSITALTSPLDILACITRPNGEAEDMPSWVMDWILLTTNRSLFTSLAGAYPSEPPFIRELPVVEFLDDKTLCIRGTLLSRVAGTVESPPGMAHQVPIDELLDPKTAKDYVAWNTASLGLVALLPGYPTGESLAEAYWRTLVCNRQTSDSEEIPENDEGYQAWCRLLQGQRVLHTGKERVTRVKYWGDGIFYTLSAAVIAGLSLRWTKMGRYKLFIPLAMPWIHKVYRDFRREVERLSCVKLWHTYLYHQKGNQIQQREFEASFSQWCQGRRFCLTENGYMGWIPIAAEEGDVLVMFNGYRVPFVLRECGDGWRILGDAYVHGWMNGVLAEDRSELPGEMLKIY